MKHRVKASARELLESELLPEHSDGAYVLEVVKVSERGDWIVGDCKVYKGPDSDLKGQRAGGVFMLNHVTQQGRTMGLMMRSGYPDAIDDMPEHERYEEGDPRCFEGFRFYTSIKHGEGKDGTPRAYINPERPPEEAEEAEEEDYEEEEVEEEEEEEEAPRQRSRKKAAAKKAPASKKKTKKTSKRR